MPPRTHAAAARAFGGLFVLVQHLTRLGDAHLAELGLTTPQWLLLAVLTQGFPGRAPSLSEAAAVYGSSRQNVKRMALGLQERGYLRLLADPGDARTVRLAVTDKVGWFDTADGQAASRRLLAAAFAGMAAADIHALDQGLGRWLSAIAPITRSRRARTTRATIGGRKDGTP